MFGVHVVCMESVQGHLYCSEKAAAYHLMCVCMWRSWAAENAVILLAMVHSNYSALPKLAI